MADRPLVIARAPIIVSGAGVTNIVIGSVDYRIHIIGLALTADATVQITLQDDHTSFMDVHLVAGGVLVLPESEAGWFRCQSGDYFSLLSSAAVNIGGIALYRLLPDHVDL